MNVLYAAVVFIYFPGTDGIRLDDILGPYKTMSECKIRAEEMFNFAIVNFIHLKPVIRAGCQTLENTKNV